MALIAGSFSIGSIVGPQTFRAKDAPGYLPAKITLMATQVVDAVLAFVIFGYYVWANGQKERKASAVGDRWGSYSGENLWENLTDKENLSFRYVY